MSKERVLRIIIVTCISLLLMFAGQWYYSKGIMERSLINSLSLKPSVASVEIKKEQGKMVLDIKLKYVDNLAEVYRDIQNTTSRQLKGNSFELRFSNKPNTALEELYNSQVQFIIYEAISTGKFTEMKAMLDDINSENRHVSPKVFLDSQNLYLQLHHGKDNFYKVIRRVS